jgi:hypothetical protein
MERGVKGGGLPSDNVVLDETHSREVIFLSKQTINYG